VVGSRTYGSGYGILGQRGVTGLGFPFVFWPIVWGATLGYGPSYLHPSEYGTPDNSSRPGGPQMQAVLQPIPPTETYHIISDNNTVQALLIALSSDCSFNNAPLVALPFTGNASDPRPEQAIQYYRASSVALTLDGYNDTAALSDTPGPDTPLPTTLNQTFLDCINNTITASVPLVDAASPRMTIGTAALLLWLVAFVRSML